MSSAPTTDVTTGDRPDPPGRAAPKVRTYLLPAILTVPLFFPTAIPAIVHAAKARGHVHERRHPAARAQADAARQWVWMTVGIGLTVWFCVFAVLSIYLNDGALRKVFFNWDVISDSWASIRKGFWLNIKLFMIAEVLVLIWALFIAILRGLPGRAATPDPVPRRRVHRPVPRAASRHRHLPDRLRRPPHRSADRRATSPSSGCA